MNDMKQDTGLRSSTLSIWIFLNVDLWWWSNNNIKSNQEFRGNQEEKLTCIGVFGLHKPETYCRLLFPLIIINKIPSRPYHDDHRHQNYFLLRHQPWYIRPWRSRWWWWWRWSVLHSVYYFLSLLHSQHISLPKIERNSQVSRHKVFKC